MKRNVRIVSRRRRKKQQALRIVFLAAIAATLLIAGIMLVDVLGKRGDAARETTLHAPDNSRATSTPVSVPPALGTPASGMPASGMPASGMPASGMPAQATPVPDAPDLFGESAAPILLPTPAPVLIPSPASGTAAEADYAFFWFTDTQYYSEKFPATFHAMTEWMRDNVQRYNVKYAFFTGDFVDGNSSTQWAVADAAMKKLEEAVPVFAIAGNHDVGSSSPDYTNFNRYFGESRYKNNPYIADWYNNAMGRCDTIEIDGTKYLFAGLGWGNGSSAISWLNKTLQKYPDHKAILFFHDYLNSEGLLSSTGSKLYEKVVKENPNVFMVLCGHRYNCRMLITDIHDQGSRENYRTVYNIMMNYQAFGSAGGDGFLALIRVYKKDKVFTVDTYSPLLNKWYFFDESETLGREKLILPVNIFD